MGEERFLKIEQSLPHRRECRDLGRGPPDRVAADDGIACARQVNRARTLDGVCFTRRIAMLLQDGECGQTVERTGIHMGEIEMPRELLGQRALARGGRAVDGDDDAHAFTACRSAPSSRMSFSNLGKLVAIIEVSSTETGSLEPRPIVRKDMAIR